MDLTGHQAERQEAVVRTVRELEARCRELARALRADAGLYCWYWSVKGDAQAAREKLAASVTELDYEAGIEAADQLTIQTTSLAAASETTLEAAAECNTAKLALRKALQACDGIVVRVGPDEKRRELARVALRAAGRPFLNRRLACRQIKLLSEQPLTVSFLWGRAPRIGKADVGEIEARLNERLEVADDEMASLLRADLRTLARLPPRTGLRWVQEQPPYPRANISFHDPEEPKRKRRLMRSAGGPILYPNADGRKPPKLRPLPPNPTPKGSSRPRKGRVLEREPLLRTLRVYLIHQDDDA